MLIPAPAENVEKLLTTLREEGEEFEAEDVDERLFQVDEVEEEEELPPPALERGKGACEVRELLA